MLNAHPGMAEAVKTRKKMTIISCRVNARPGMSSLSIGFRIRTVTTRGHKAAMGRWAIVMDDECVTYAE